MDRQFDREARRRRIKRRIHKKVRGTMERPRLAVFKSDRHMYAQVVDDAAGKTLAAASTLDRSLRAAGGGGNRAAAKRVGSLIAEKLKALGVERVVFDRGGYVYHGRVKELAEAAREGGLKF